MSVIERLMVGRFISCSLEMFVEAPVRSAENLDALSVMTTSFISLAFSSSQTAML